MATKSQTTTTRAPQRRKGSDPRPSDMKEQRDSDPRPAEADAEVDPRPAPTYTPGV